MTFCVLINEEKENKRSGLLGDSRGWDGFVDYSNLSRIEFKEIKYLWFCPKMNRDSAFFHAFFVVKRILLMRRINFFGMIAKT